MARVLAIDPDRRQPELIARLTHEVGAHACELVGSWADASAAIDRQLPDLIVVAGEPKWAHWFKPAGAPEDAARESALAFLAGIRMRVEAAPPKPSVAAKLLERLVAAREPISDALCEWAPAVVKLAAAAALLAGIGYGGLTGLRWWNARPAPQAAVATSRPAPPPAKPAPPRRQRRAVTEDAADTAALPAWLALFSPVELTVIEAGHEIRFDENSQAMFPAGRHELTLANRALGYRETRVVRLKAGVVTPVSIVLPKTTISLDAVPSADVVIDGTHVGVTPIADVAVELGTREIVLNNATYGQRRFTITATVKPIRLEIDLTKPVQ